MSNILKIVIFLFFSILIFCFAYELFEINKLTGINDVIISKNKYNYGFDPIGATYSLVAIYIGMLSIIFAIFGVIGYSKIEAHNKNYLDKLVKNELKTINLATKVSIELLENDDFFKKIEGRIKTEEKTMKKWRE